MATGLKKKKTKKKKTKKQKKKQKEKKGNNIKVFQSIQSMLKYLNKSFHLIILTDGSERLIFLLFSF